MLTFQRRRRLRSHSHRLIHPDFIVSQAEKFIRRLSTHQIVLAIVACFCVVFGFLAFYLPVETRPVRTFEAMDAHNDSSASSIGSGSKNTQVAHTIPDNIDSEGHVHIFYYPWYGNPPNDAMYIHWNHDILPHWDDIVNSRYKIGEEYDPEQDEIGAVYYPMLGAYSSSDTQVVAKHFAMLLNANVTVIVVSWHSPIAVQHNPDQAFAKKDEITAKNLDLLFRLASMYGMQIAIHLEPYTGRTAESTFQDLQYLHEKYSHHPSYYKSAKHGNKPFFYMYDSYKMSDQEWKKLLVKGVDNKLCVRDTKLDGIFLGLYLNKQPSEHHIVTAGFDGFYTYFAADGFTQGSTPKKHWRSMAKWAMDNSLLFVPSVGPGYNDERVRPWNSANTKARDNGEYYARFWNEIYAINDGGWKKNRKENDKQDQDEKENELSKDREIAIEYVSITSFNEWHEGTQIEPSIAKVSNNGYKYKDFEAEGGSNAYLKMTKQFVSKFLTQQ